MYHMCEEDLELGKLGQFYGTEQYHEGYLNTKLTDGVAYISKNGYSWLVTDAISVIKTKLKDEPFICIKLKLNGDPDNKTADMIITDGNEKELYKQHYNFTTAKRNLTLYCIDNVMLLSLEY